MRRLPLILSVFLLAACGSSTMEAPTPTPGPSVESSAPTPTPTPEPLSVTIAAAGDILSHWAVIESAAAHAGGQGYNYEPLFADIAPLVSEADIAVCQLETPISPDNSHIDGGRELVFNAPREVAAGVAAAGFDTCSFASNHTVDQGLQGITDTEAVIRDAGLHYAGATMDESRAGHAEMINVGDAVVAHLAYTYTFPNAGGPTTSIPDGAPWLVANSWPSIGAAGIIEQARMAKEQGADFVVISMHWGAEYVQQPTDDQRAIANEVLNSPEVDLILGHHVHVVQPCEQINAKHVIYGMGNILSNQAPFTHSSLPAASQDGVVTFFELTKDADGHVTSEMSYAPTQVEHPGHTIRLVTPESNRESWDRTTSAINALGGCDATVR